MNLPFAPLAALLFGTGAALGAALLPTPMLEGLVTDSGIAAILAAAEPPLGTTARLAIAGGTGAATALFSWLALFVLFGTRGLTIGRAEAVPAEASQTPVLRRADAHPDAPPRAPLLATRDLGTPFLDVIARSKPEAAPSAAAPEPLFAPAPAARAVDQIDSHDTPPPVAAPAPAPAPVQRAATPPQPRIVLPDERLLPENLDQPLAAFDPAAIRETPAPLPEAVAPLRHAPRPAVFDSSERFETFELTPVRRDPPRPRAVPEPHVHAAAKAETEATIHALLERLEQGVVRRGLATGTEPERKPRDAERGLEEALVTLRNLARRA